MNLPPNTVLPALAGASFLASFVAACRWNTRWAAWVAPLRAAGIVLLVVALAAGGRARGSFVPLGDNADSLLWLGALLACATAYVQWRRPLRGLDLFATPLTLAAVSAALVVGVIGPREYSVDSIWHVVHRGTSYAGAAAFTLAAAASVTYLIARARLRHRDALAGASLGSLERTERITHVASTVGFALLSVALATGVIWIVAGRTDVRAWSPKVVLACAVWVVYALVSHAPASVSLHGRRLAVLSLAGFALLVGALVAAQLV